MDIGIDLGTTYSIIAVNGQVRLADDYPPGHYLADCDVTIIPTPEGELLFPSAVWQEPNNPGEFLIGLEALQKADEGEAPILFSKRKMGTSEQLLLHERKVMARDVAREILKYLKSCAEQALGQQVHRAVVTHPAYFDRSQVEETRLAAIEAGFDMSLPEQMLMEPVAAALTYARTDTRDPLRLLTYDLGGGTFDVTYVERRGGVISMLAFDGHHLLGGYNFDREIIHWLLKGLEAKGRYITFDENNPVDRGRLAQMLRLAEDTKIRLAKSSGDDVKVEIRAPNLLVDTSGRRVSVLESLTRNDFAGLIRPYLEETVQCCKNALRKAQADESKLDEILLVGGSSYGPWVSKILQEGFPELTPKLFWPDLCVGVGAALHAALVLPTIITQTPSPAQMEESSPLQVILEVPAKSVTDIINITGRVVQSGKPRLGDLSVTLSLPTKRCLGPEPLSSQGRFLFADVDLFDRLPNQFILCLQDAEGRNLLEHPFEIIFAPETTDVTTISTVLPKPLYLETLDGLVPLAQEGAVLPARCHVILVRDNDNPSISIRIFQQRDPIGAIRIEDIPPEGGRNSKVDLTVIVNEKNQIVGNVRIINPAGQLVKEAPVQVGFDIPETPELAALMDQFASLQMRYLEVVDEEEEDEEQRSLLARANLVIERVSQLLNRQPLDRQEVHAELQKLFHLLNPISDDMEPNRKRFVSKLESCKKSVGEMVNQAQEVLMAGEGEWDEGRTKSQDSKASEDIDATLIAKAKGNLQKAEYFARRLARVESEGLPAHESKDRKTWARVNDELDALAAQLDKTPPLELSGFILKLVAFMHFDQGEGLLDRKEREVEQKGLLGDWHDYIAQLRTEIDNLRQQVIAIDDDLPTPQVRAQLGVIIVQKLKPIEDRIRNIGIDTRKK